MLKSTTERYQSFIDFITSKKIVDVPCLVVIIPNYPAIMADDGSRKMGFACYTPSYLPEYGLMYVAADEEAEKWADWIIDEFKHFMEKETI